jgi:hypothetical protein
VVIGMDASLAHEEPVVAAHGVYGPRHGARGQAGGTETDDELGEIRLGQLGRRLPAVGRESGQPREVALVSGERIQGEAPFGAQVIQVLELGRDRHVPAFSPNG